MAATFVSNASTFLPSLSSSPTSSSQRQLVVCKAVNTNEPLFPALILSKRNMSIGLTTTFFMSLAGKGIELCSAAILEADDDIELMEKVKKDRQKRLEKQSVISSSDQDKEYLQDLVYKLSKVGQAIEKNDLPRAASVLGQKSDAEWVQKTNAALNKLSSSPEEKAQADAINSSLSTLISSGRSSHKSSFPFCTAVGQKDIKASTVAFVASANALEKWTILTGLAGQLKGL